tara:strand:+ start:980 stop:2632 length:1653 start_codon:yes stop_codon:yes gene_type:complete
MSRYGNLGAFDYRVTNVPQYDLEADINKGIERGMKFGQMIGQKFKSEADKTIERQKQIANQLALDKIDLAQKESLILPSDSDSGSINKARVDFSNKLVDRLNQAKIARDDGRLTAADYSKVVMTLEAQIPAYKGAEQVMARGMELYADGLTNNRLSKANSPTSEEFWSAMLRGKADVSYEYDENGKMEMVGTWINSEGKEQPIKAALEKFENLPFILEKPVDSEGKVITAASARAVDVENILATKQGSAMAKLTSRTGPGGAAIYETNGVQPIMTKDLKGNDVVQPWFQQLSDDSFNGYFNSLGNGDLKMGIMQYILDGEPTARDLDEDGVDDGFGYSAVKDLVENKTIDELTLIKNKLKAQYTDMLVTDVQKANKAKVDQLNTSAMGDAAAYAKDEAAILRTQQLKNQIAKQNKEDGKGSNNKISSLTPTQNKLYNLYSSIQDATSSFAPNPLNPSQSTIQIDQKKFGKAVKEIMGLDFGTDDENNFILSSGTQTFNNGKPLVIAPSNINSPAVLLQRIGESFKDPDTKQPIDYNTILSMFRQRNQFGY